MLGQAHTPWRRLLSFAALAVSVLAVPGLGTADSSRSASSLRAQDAALAAKSRAAVLGLYSLDHQVASAQTALQALQSQTAALRSQQAILHRQLTIARRSASTAQRRLGQRLRTLYEQGDVSALEVILGARTLDDALTNIDTLNRAARQDQQVLHDVKATRAELAGTARSLSARADVLASATRAANATATALERVRDDRAAYIASLAAQRRMTQRQIDVVVQKANAAERRTVVLTHSVDALPVVAPISFATGPPQVAAGGRVLTVSATGYSLPGHTASGLPVGIGVVAVDPSVIPLGTHMTVPGYGEAVAADTGTAIIGDRIDLWFPTLADASAWGRRTVTIVLR